MTITWFNSFCVWSLHGTLLARVCCACTVCINAMNLCIYYVCAGYRSALQALGISERFSAPTLTVFPSGESFTPGSHTEGVSE